MDRDQVATNGAFLTAKPNRNGNCVLSSHLRVRIPPLSISRKHGNRPLSKGGLRLGYDNALGSHIANNASNLAEVKAAEELDGATP